MSKSSAPSLKTPPPPSIPSPPINQILHPQKIERRKLLASVEHISSQGIPEGDSEEETNTRNRESICPPSSVSTERKGSINLDYSPLLKKLPNGLIKPLPLKSKLFDSEGGFKLGQRRQSSFAGLLPTTLKETSDSEKSKSASPGTKSDPFIKLHRTSSVPFVDTSFLPQADKNNAQGALKRSRRDSKKLTVHFPDERVKELKLSSQEQNEPPIKAVETSTLRAGNRTSAILTDKEFSTDDTDSDNKSNSGPIRSRLPKFYPRSVSVAIPDALDNSEHSLPNSFSNTPHLPEVNLGEIRRQGATEKVKTVSSSNLESSTVVDHFPAVLPETNTFPSITGISSRQLQHSTSIPTVFGKSISDPPNTKVINVQEVKRSSVTIISSQSSAETSSKKIIKNDNRSVNRSSEEFRKEKLITESKSATNINEILQYNSALSTELELSRKDDSAKSVSSPSGVRKLFRRGSLTLPSVKKKHPKPSADEVKARNEFFARFKIVLPPDLAEALYDKMKGRCF